MRSPRALLSATVAASVLLSAAASQVPFFATDQYARDTRLHMEPQPAWASQSANTTVGDTWTFLDGHLISGSREELGIPGLVAETVILPGSTAVPLPSLSVRLEQTGTLTCKVCQRVIRAAQNSLLRNGTETSVIKAATKVCESTGAQSPRVCAELVRQFGPWAFEVLVHAVFNPENICSSLSLCPKRKEPDAIVAIPPKTAKSPPPEGPRLGRGGEKTYVVHLSDWHFDEEYKEGYEAECNEPVCCRPPYSPADTPKLLGRPVVRRAGRYGDYNCDVPSSLVESLIKFLPSVVPVVDMVFMTGDMPPHDIWAETQDSVLTAADQTASDLRRAFGDTAVFAAVGNHEGAPINDYPTKRLVENGIADPIDWLYHSLADQWSPWLPSGAASSLRERGHYSAPVPGVPKRRVIAINTNMGYRFNWWLLVTKVDEPDPDGVLGWLVEELYQAEQNGEGVYIIGHMCPLDADSHPWFGREFARIVARFSGTILGQFYGHTHKDEFQVFFSSVPGTPEATSETDYGSPIGVAYVGPSLTPFKNVNPAFRVYEIDKETGVVLDHRTFYFDLREANAPGSSPKWKELYSARALYGMQDVRAKSWASLTDKFLSEDDALTRYLRLRSREADSASFITYQSGAAVRCEASAKCRKHAVCKAHGGRIFPLPGCPGPKDIRGRLPWVAAGGGGGNAVDGEAALGRISLEIAGGGDVMIVEGIASQVFNMVGQLVAWDPAAVAAAAEASSSTGSDVNAEDGEERPVCR